MFALLRNVLLSYCYYLYAFLHYCTLTLFTLNFIFFFFGHGMFFGCLIFTPGFVWSIVFYCNVKYLHLLIYLFAPAFLFLHDMNDIRDSVCPFWHDFTQIIILLHFTGFLHTMNGAFLLFNIIIIPNYHSNESSFFFI